MDYKPWYVYYFGSKGAEKCSCFEDNEQQARFFASQVNGRLKHGYTWVDEEERHGRN